MTNYWESDDYKEFAKYCKIKVAELDEWFKVHPLSEVKTLEDNREYWHNKIQRCCLNDLGPDNGLSYYYLQGMRICVACMEHSKKISPSAFARWKEYWGCFVMDTTGEAHCVLGHKYYTSTEMHPYDKKGEWEEIIELGNKYYDLMREEPKRQA